MLPQQALPDSFTTFSLAVDGSPEALVVLIAVATFALARRAGRF